MLQSYTQRSIESMSLVCATDYSYDFNLSESVGPPATYLPEDFTYLPSQMCPERLLSMSKYIVCL